MVERDVNVRVRGHDEASGPVGRVTTSLHRLRDGATVAGKGIGELGGAAGGKSGIGAVAGGLTGLIGPVGLVVGGFDLLAHAAGSLTETYQHHIVTEGQLEAAAKTHHLSLEALTAAIDRNKGAWANLGFSEDATRPSITRLAQAGLTQKEIFAALPHIMDIARAKHMDLEQATQTYTRAILGSARALIDLGIKLPPPVAGYKLLANAQKAVATDAAALTKAHERLAVVHAALADKTTLTASEHLRLQTAEEGVTTAAAKLHKAHLDLEKAQKAHGVSTSRLTLLNHALGASIGGAAEQIPPMARAQAHLSNAWIAVSSKVAPALLAALGWLTDALATMVDWVGKAADVIGPILGPAIGVVIEAVKIWATVMDHTWIPVIKFVLSVLGNLVSFIVGKVGPPITAAVRSIAGAFGVMGDIIGGVWDGILQVIGSVVGTIIGIIKNVVGVAASFPNPFQDSAKRLQHTLAGMQTNVESWGHHTTRAVGLAGSNSADAFDRGMASFHKRIAGTAEGLAAAAKAGLIVNAYPGGASVASSWLAGIIARLNAGIMPGGDLERAVADVRNAFGHSLPTKGPFAGDAAAAGGRAIGQSWVKALSAAVSAFRMPGDLLAGAGAGSIIGTPAGTGPGGGGSFVFSPQFGSLLPYTPGQAKQLSHTMVPELVRELKRQGFI